jgi:hypothetical protein
VGTRSMSLPVQQRLNSASAFDSQFPGGGLTPLPTYFNPSDVPATVTAPASTLANFTAFCPSAGVQPVAPCRRLSSEGFLGSLTTFPPSGSGIYHAASADFTHRFTRGLYFRANYTFSKNIDNSTNELFSSFVNPRRSQDGFNFPNERGRSALDIPHKFAVTWVYDLPALPNGNGFVKAVANGWEWSGTYLAESGQPVTALSGVDSNLNGDGAGDRTVFNPNGHGLTGSQVNPVCNDGAGGATRIVSSGNPACASAHVVGYVAADPTATFIQAGKGALATTGRNTIGTPGLNIWNMSVLKTTKFSERYSLQLRASAYDVFNHRNFSVGLPSNNGALDSNTNTNPLQAGYVTVTATGAFLNSHIFNGGSRTMEFGLKLIW